LAHQQRPPTTADGTWPGAEDAGTVQPVSKGTNRRRNAAKRGRRRKVSQQGHPSMPWTPATSEPGEIYTPQGGIRAAGALARGLKNRRRILQAGDGLLGLFYQLLMVAGFFVALVLFAKLLGI
jgi:hypothetical protein